MISIITPVYNSEKYLDKYIKSVLNQTYKNFELILVDDCSTDESYNICKKYSESDSRIKLLRQEKNGGSSKARNLGLKHATGNYIMFADSDDYLPNNALEILYNSLINNNSDIAMGGFYTDCCNEIKLKKFRFSKKIYLSNEIIVNYLNYKTLYGFSCGKLYKKEILKDIFFPEDVKIGEDSIFSFYTYSKAKKISFTKTPVYYYRVRNDSISLHGCDISERELGTLAQLNYIKKEIGKKNFCKDIEVFEFELKYQLYLKYINSSKDTKIEFKEKFETIKKYLDEKHFKVFCNARNLKIKLHVLNYCFRLRGIK